MENSKWFCKCSKTEYDSKTEACIKFCIERQKESKNENDKGDRFLLGEVWDESKKLLVCIGMNPSTAVPKKLDGTVRKIQNYAKSKIYGGWYMLNLYPCREPNSKKLQFTGDEPIVTENINFINSFLDEIKLSKPDFLLIWGVGSNKDKKFIKIIDQIKEQDVFDIQDIVDIYVCEPKNEARRGAPFHCSGRVMRYLEVEDGEILKLTKVDCLQSVLDKK